MPVAESDTLRVLARMLGSADIGAALVRSENGAFKMVSERDIARALR